MTQLQHSFILEITQLCLSNKTRVWSHPSASLVAESFHTYKAIIMLSQRIFPSYKCQTAIKEKKKKKAEEKSNGSLLKKKKMDHQ